MKIKNAIFAAAALLLAQLSSAAFDPVHEDIDIFMVNPSISSERPNVLIVLDTSANWSSHYATEKTALISVVNGLTEQYNVGLAINAGGSIEGSYLRYAVRQMTGTNKTALSSLVNELTNAPSTSFAGDKTNNAVAGQSMVEAYRYFKGLSSYSASTSNAGHDPRTDYSGNATNSWITTLAGNAFSSTPAVASTYASPISDGCQKNFVIYISNGKGSNQTGEKTTAKNELSAALAAAKTELTGVVDTSGWAAAASAISPLSPTGNETDSWFDEWAKFLAKSGFAKSVNGTTKKINVSTYVVEVGPGSQSADQQWSATLKSGASNGNGKYFAATGDDPGTSLLNALNAIFNEIQAVNSVFASTTLPVSVNVRGTNLNQVYIGMFRPDAAKQPRWFGNLKLYKLGLNGNSLELQDATGVAAESLTTGFVLNTARSYWTHDSTFWSYRSSDENGQGGQSDSPDGDLVEKGAVAQRLREAFAASQSGRNLYTCTTGSYAGCNACTVGGSGTAQTCSGATALSTTPFSTANTDITTINLGLGTKDVSGLTAKSTKTVTAIADRRNVAISNSTGTAYAIAAVSNGAISKALTGLTPFDSSKTMAITALTGLTTASFTIGGVGVSSSGNGANTVNTFTVTTTAAHGISAGDTVTISGNTRSNGQSSDINGSRTVATVPTPTTFTFTISGSSITSGSNGTVTTTPKSTTATATVAALPAGLTVNSRINISGASPSAFNGDFQVTAVNAGAKTFTYTVSSSQGAAAATGTLKVYNTVSSGVYAAGSTTVRITATAASHGFAAGDSVTLAGVTPGVANGISVYGGTYAIASVPSTNSFTYDMSFATASPLYPPGDATAFGTAYKGATTTVTVTTATANALAGNVDVTGLSSCFNVSNTAITVISATQFSYTTGSACAPLSSIPSGAAASGSAYGTTVTATLAGHGYAVNSIVAIDDGTTLAHRGGFTVTSVPNSDTFTYEYTGACPCVGPSGQYTVRLANNPLAYATAVGHGFSSNDSIAIAGANPGGYNGAQTITVTGADTFTYALAAAPGTNTGTGVTASKNTTTAVATSVNHGFADQSSVLISGASPAAFNGTFTVTYVNPNTFTYALGSAQGDASGTIRAAAGSGSGSERDNIINWMRGQDNNEDENANGSVTDCRASVHGDVLHSRPAVINYNRYGGDNDVYIFYGANDGVFRAVKGGTATDAGDGSGLLPGQEAWGFVPSEGFGNLKRLRNNSPVIGSSYKKPYFMDGPIGVYTVDGNGDGMESPATASDKVYLYVGARRGGRYLYSLDVTDPLTPKYRWKIDNATAGFAELGYTWSQPTVVKGINNYTNPVLFFGGGYDPDVEDIENCTITSTTAASVNNNVYTGGSVTYSNGTVTYASGGTGCTVANGVATTRTRTMGRAIYAVDAITGAKIWSASYPGSGADLEVPGMDYAISSDVTIVRNLSGGAVNHGYVGDNGGNLWRFDFSDSNRGNWTVTKVASISDLGTSAGRRKFQNPPDVVSMTTYDAVLIGAGDREHPFDNTVANRFYMFKDFGTDNGPGTGTTYSRSGTTTRAAANDGSGNPVITETNGSPDGYLYDATADCVEACSTSGAKAAAAAALAAADGWYITLGTGEKTIGNPVALNGVVFFNTNQPSQTADNSCVGNLGIARQYQVGVTDATAKTGLGTNASSRSTIFPGGGFLPSPVHVVVQVTNAAGEAEIKEGVISGTSVQTPATGAIGTRTRRFWYKEID